MNSETETGVVIVSFIVFLIWLTMYSLFYPHGERREGVQERYDEQVSSYQGSDIIDDFMALAEGDSSPTDVARHQPRDYESNQP